MSHLGASGGDGKNYRVPKRNDGEPRADGPGLLCRNSQLNWWRVHNLPASEVILLARLAAGLFFLRGARAGVDAYRQPPLSDKFRHVDVYRA
jgi:hypothetical protein